MDKEKDLRSTKETPNDILDHNEILYNRNRLHGSSDQMPPMDIINDTTLF
ncbi:hypothetical protein JK157_19660 [Enterobacter mori]|nr:hypothetical protein [Enterobacter mori]